MALVKVFACTRERRSENTENQHGRDLRKCLFQNGPLGFKTGYRQNRKPDATLLTRSATRPETQDGVSYPCLICDESSAQEKLAQIPWENKKYTQMKTMPERKPKISGRVEMWLVGTAWATSDITCRSVATIRKY